MDKETKFVDGMRWFDARESAPEFIKGTISIDPKKLVAYLRENAQYMDKKGYMRITMKESKGGKIYFQLDTWKKPEQVTEQKIEEDEEIPF